MAIASLPDEVRAHCAAIAAAARHVRIDPAAGTATDGIAGLDPEQHFLEGDDEAVARYVLVLDAVNFGSGWFPTLRHGSTPAMTARLTEHARARGGRPWDAAELAAVGAADVALVLDEDPGHELMGHYARALNELGALLGRHDGRALRLVGAAGRSASALARILARELPSFADHGFYKRAQIAANDLALAGVARFDDLDTLTVFADNFLPHVLRHDGVLVLDPDLERRIDAGEPLPAGSPEERELRACAVHACELHARRLGVAPRVLDNWLWNRGLQSPYADRPAHRTLTLFY